MEKIAYLVLAHRDPEQLQRLVCKLDDPRFDFFIHIDKKKDITPFTAITEKVKNSKVTFIIDRVSCYYFDYSLVQAELNLLKATVGGIKYKYCVLISGQDYPLKSNDYIYNILINNYPTCFIDSYSVAEAPKHGINWVEKIGYKYYSQRLRRVFQDLVGNKYYYGRIGFIFRGICRIYDMMMTCVSKSPRQWLSGSEFTYSAGSQFWMLPDKAVYHVLMKADNSPLLRKTFNHSSAVEESYFQTSLSSFKEAIIPDSYAQAESKLAHMDNSALRMIKWHDGDIDADGHPFIWKSKDFELLKNCKALFGRKFEISEDSEILDKLDELISSNHDN